MSMPSLSEGSDGLQPVRLFNRGAVEEKGEGARLVRLISLLSLISIFPSSLTNHSIVDLLCWCDRSRRSRQDYYGTEGNGT